MATTATQVVLDTPAAEFRLPATDGKDLRTGRRCRRCAGPQLALILLIDVRLFGGCSEGAGHG
jgi:hypothetical protein